MQLFMELSQRKPQGMTLLLFVRCRFAPLEQINTFLLFTFRTMTKEQIFKEKEQMKITTITMPKGCRYMGEDNSLVSKLPHNGKFILNKTVTGCGGTSLFLNSDIPVVIISPRLHALKDKFEQHPGCFLFHTPYTNKAKRAGEITRLMSDLKAYMDAYGAYPFFKNTMSPKVLVTLDSSGKVLDVLKSCGVINEFLYVVDEFQCLMGDAAFKGNTDMNFLIRLDGEVKSICYLSATPIPDICLDYIPQFKDIPYFKLEWDPAVLEEPNIREVRMKKGGERGKVVQPNNTGLQGQRIFREEDSQRTDGLLHGSLHLPERSQVNQEHNNQERLAPRRSDNPMLREQGFRPAKRFQARRTVYGQEQPREQALHFLHQGVVRGSRFLLHQRHHIRLHQRGEGMADARHHARHSANPRPTEA